MKRDYKRNLFIIDAWTGSLNKGLEIKRESEDLLLFLREWPLQRVL